MYKKYYPYLVIALVVFAVLGGAIYVKTGASQNTSRATAYVSPSSGSSDSTAAKNISQEDRIVTKVGVVTCLRASDTNGPKAASCAIGLYDNNGVSYALYSDDPYAVADLTTDQRIQVTGVIKQQNTGYDTSGVLVIQSIRRLN